MSTDGSTKVPGERTESRSARERLLKAADALFYTEGVNTVGIDRVIEQAGVAKASLYRLFTNKEGLVAAYLEARHAQIRDEFSRALESTPDPRDKILAVFDVQAGWTRRPAYRGCAFTRAIAEPVGGASVEQAVEAYRRYILALLTDLAGELPVREPDLLGLQLYALYQAAAPARDPRRRELMSAVRSAVETLIDTATRS